MIRRIVLRLLESYFRHRFLSLGPIVLMTVLAGAWFLTATPAYIARAAVYVNKDSLLASLTPFREHGFSWVTPAEATVDQYNELLKTDAFVRSAVHLTDLEEQMSEGPEAVAATLVEARDAVWVQTLGNNLILVGAAYEEPEVAQQLAAAVIETYTQWKVNTRWEESLAAVEFFDGLIETYQQELTAAQEELRAYLEAHPEPVRGDRPASEELEMERLRAAFDQAFTRRANALASQESAQLAVAVAESEVRRSYVVLDAPRLPLSPERSRRNMLMTGTVFVVVGIVLTLVGVVGSALLDRTMRFPSDVRVLLELPMLAAIPDVCKESGKDEARNQPDEASAIEEQA